MNPFDPNHFIGYINHVNPQYVRVHFPSSVLLNKYIFSGEEFNGGLIGNFVTIEGENHGFIGKISELDLPEKERLSLSERAFQSSDFHPTAKVEILLCFDYFCCDKAERSLNSFPNIGAKVYVCAKKFIERYVSSFGRKSTSEDLFIELGTLTSNRDTVVNISQQAMFGRHCAVVGTTGGGKSWSVSKLIESMKRNKTKAILIDPTGEYEELSEANDSINSVLGITSFFSYRKLTIEDLFFLVKPSGRVQAPKLLDAIRSLKCINLNIKNEPGMNEFCENGNLKKTGMDKKGFERFCYSHIEEIDDGSLNFDFKKLERQINLECIYDTDSNNQNLFGRRYDNDLNNCISLITRVANIRRTKILQDVFGFSPGEKVIQDLTDIIDSFMKDKEKFLLRIGFEYIGFESQAREIVANAVGKYLLTKARNNEFKECPTVLFIDEAHQFLNKNIVDEYFQASNMLAFDNIAKECRKYGLFLCLATQMPKDIPIGTLSQVGCFLVHRLINQYDKEAIRQACSSANNDIMNYLPVLGAGEALLTGIEFPMPLTIKINEPDIQPDSKTPTFKVIE